MIFKINRTGHCIETNIKRNYNQRLAEVFKHRGNIEQLEMEIAVLKKALETLDFSWLRKTYPSLRDQCDNTIEVGFDEKNNLCIKVDNQPILIRQE